MDPHNFCPHSLFNSSAQLRTLIHPNSSCNSKSSHYSSCCSCSSSTCSKLSSRSRSPRFPSSDSGSASCLTAPFVHDSRAATVGTVDILREEASASTGTSSRFYRYPCSSWWFCCSFMISLFLLSYESAWHGGLTFRRCLYLGLTPFHLPVFITYLSAFFFLLTTSFQMTAGGGGGLFPKM